MFKIGRRETNAKILGKLKLANLRCHVHYAKFMVCRSHLQVSCLKFLKNIFFLRPRVEDVLNARFTLLVFGGCLGSRITLIRASFC